MPLRLATWRQIASRSPPGRRPRGSPGSCRRSGHARGPARRPDDQGPLLGDVALHGDIAGQRPGVVPDRRDDGFLGVQRPVLPAVDEVRDPGATGRQRRPHGLVERRRLGPAAEEPGVPPDDLRAAVSADPLERGIDVGDAGVEVGDHHGFGDLLDDHGQPVPLAAGALALGHIDPDAGQEDPAGGVERELQDQEVVRSVGERQGGREGLERPPRMTARSAVLTLAATSAGQIASSVLPYQSSPRRSPRFASR